MQIQCPECNEWIDSESELCPHCQNRINFTEDEDESDNRKFNPVTYQPSYLNDSLSERQKDNLKSLIVPLAFIIFLILISIL